MSNVYRVEWRRIVAPISKSIAFVASVPVIVGMVARYVEHDFDWSTTFQHLSFPIFLLLLACILLGSIVFGLLVATWLRLAGITLDNESISGRNVWFFRNTIPLSNITGLTPYGSNGIYWIIVNSNCNGKVYISDATENIDELLEIISAYISDVNPTGKLGFKVQNKAVDPTANRECSWGLKRGKGGVR